MMQMIEPFVVSMTLCLILLSVVVYLAYRIQQRKKEKIANDLKQLCLLRKLIGEFQRHRGLSTGVLGGDNSLVNDLNTTRHELSNLLSTVKGLLPILPSRWESLFGQWHKVLKDSDHSSERNIDNHNRLIRRTIFLFEDIASELELGLDRAEQERLEVLWQEVPQTAEWIGQARALGTGIAAKKSSHADQRIRLRFLHQKIEQQAGVVFNTLQNQVDPELNRSVLVLLSIIDNDLLSSETPEIDAKKYFDQATQTINLLLMMLDQVLNKLEQQHA